MPFGERIVAALKCAFVVRDLQQVSSMMTWIGDGRKGSTGCEGQRRGEQRCPWIESVGLVSSNQFKGQGVLSSVAKRKEPDQQVSVQYCSAVISSIAKDHYCRERRSLSTSKGGRAGRGAPLDRSRLPALVRGSYRAANCLKKPFRLHASKGSRCSTDSSQTYASLCATFAKSCDMGLLFFPFPSKLFIHVSKP